jgi:hypothetical protein
VTGWDDLAHLPGLGEAIRPIWARLGSAGATWAGSERVAMVAQARAARDGHYVTAALAPPVGEAVEVVAARPASIRRATVELLVAQPELGGHAGYVELVGVVSRAVAIDTVFESLGLDRPALPRPLDGAPSGRLDDRARPGKAWVPMVGGASITQALSLVPAENADLEALHGPLYLTFDEMGDAAIDKALSRPQMELVAARTSAHNACFY